MSGIPWNKEAVYNYFSAAPYYWNRKIVDQEIFGRYSKSYSNWGWFDTRTIMQYHIPQDFIMPNNYGIQWNTCLSLYDKEGIQAIYS
jgi:serralysin